MVKKRDWKARRTTAFGRIATAPAIVDDEWEKRRTGVEVEGYRGFSDLVVGNFALCK